MAGEVIRDVILRVKIEHGDKSGINQAALDASRLVNSTSGLSDQTKKLTEGQKLLAEEVKKLHPELRKAAEAYVLLGVEGRKSLGDLIALHKQLTAASQQRGGLPGGGGVPGGGVIPGRPVPQTPGGYLETIQGVQSRLSNALAPVAIAAMVPAVANQIKDAFQAANEAFFGKDRSLPGQDAPSSFLANLLNTGPGRALVDSPLGNTPFHPFAGTATVRDIANQQRDSLLARDRAAVGNQNDPSRLLQEEAKARQQVIDGMNKQTEAQRSALQTELSLHDKRIASIQATIAAEEARIDSAREQFGLLDAQKKQDFIAIAQKAAAEGVGALSKRELELVQGNQAFTGLLSEQAKKAADESGFSKVIELLELDKKIEREERQLELSLEVKQAAEIELKGLEKPLVKFRGELEELTRKIMQEALTENMARVAAILRQRDAGQAGPDF
jgi:hypothetical protein